MFTALALLLVQSVIELPSSGTMSGGGGLQPKTEAGASTSMQPAQVDVKPPEGDPSATAAASSKPDDEVLITSSYKKALITAHTFLSVFLRK